MSGEASLLAPTQVVQRSLRVQALAWGGVLLLASTLAWSRADLAALLASAAILALNVRAMAATGNLARYRDFALVAATSIAPLLVLAAGVFHLADWRVTGFELGRDEYFVIERHRVRSGVLAGLALSLPFFAWRLSRVDPRVAGYAMLSLVFTLSVAGVFAVVAIWDPRDAAAIYLCAIPFLVARGLASLRAGAAIAGLVLLAAIVHGWAEALPQDAREALPIHPGYAIVGLAAAAMLAAPAWALAGPRTPGQRAAALYVFLGAAYGLVPWVLGGLEATPLAMLGVSGAVLGGGLAWYARRAWRERATLSVGGQIEAAYLCALALLYLSGVALEAKLFESQTGKAVFGILWAVLIWGWVIWASVIGKRAAWGSPEKSARWWARAGFGIADAAAMLLSLGAGALVVAFLLPHLRPELLAAAKDASVISERWQFRRLAEDRYLWPGEVGAGVGALAPPAAYRAARDRLSGLPRPASVEAVGREEWTCGSHGPGALLVLDVGEVLSRALPGLSRGSAITQVSGHAGAWVAAPRSCREARDFARFRVRSEAGVESVVERRLLTPPPALDPSRVGVLALEGTRVGLVRGYRGADVENALRVAYKDEAAEIVLDLRQPLRWDESDIVSVATRLLHAGRWRFEYRRGEARPFSERLSEDDPPRVLYRQHFSLRHAGRDADVSTRSGAGMGLRRVFALTSGRTCGNGDEILLLALRSHAQVITFGEATCGQPYLVDVLPWTGDEERTLVVGTVKNLKGETGEGGIKPDCPVKDDLTAPAGGERDPVFGAALHYIRHGRCPGG